MTLHPEPHPLAGQTVKLALAFTGLHAPIGNFCIEDWWDRLGGVRPWGEMRGNYACINYAIRSAMGELPYDDEVVYGKDEQGLGHIVHVSELVEPE